MKRGKKGFTMVELLIVLIILGILVAVATPMYLANVQRSRASEAVATMGMIRQAERERIANGNAYIAEAAGGDLSALNIPSGTTQYFSHGAYSVTVGAPPAGAIANFAAGGPAAQDFLVVANGLVTGGNNVACAAGGGANCAVNAAQAATIQLQMDNSGRTFVSYDTGGTWNAW